MDKVNIFLTFRYLSGKEQKGFFSIFTIFSIVGVILGIAVLITVVSVMNGFQDNTIEKTISLQSFHITLKKVFDEKIDNYEQIINQLYKIENIKLAFPVIETPILYNIDGNIGSTLLRAYGKDYFNSEFFKKNFIIKEGNLNKREDILIIGSEFAYLKNFNLNSNIALYSITGNNIIPRFKITKAHAIFKTGFYPVDSSIFYSSIELAQYILNLDKKSCYSISIIVDDLKNVNYVKNEILKLYGFEYRALTWMDYMGSLYEAFKNEKNLLIFIIFLIIIVAAFNMVSSQIMLIMIKRKEIGILKALGFSPDDIKSIFIYYGLIIAIVGVSIGLIIGLLLTKNLDLFFNILEKFINNFIGFINEILTLFNIKYYIPKFQIFSREIYYFEKVPVKVKFFEVFSIIFFSTIVILISSYLPAKKAASLKPKEVIHNE
ncbi:MAG: FtsX-like permease family protein [Spirochaetes bacterium]|nr:FtsX-like permease family protein [Spirochaetota bacterium]